MAEIATLAPSRSRFGISLPLLFGVVVFADAVALGSHLLADPDTYWHISVGHWILAHQTVPHRGIFSYPMAAKPWVADEWLSEVVIAVVYDHLGWTGLVLVVGLLLAATLAILLRFLLRTLEPAHALIATGLAWEFCLPHLLVRPHMFGLPILVLWVAALVTARSADRAPSPALAPVMTLWANLHAGYVLGLGLAALLGGEALLAAAGRQQRLRVLRGWGVFAALALGFALLTPYGVDGLLLPFRLMRMRFAMSLVIEWRSPDFQPFHPLELWIGLALLGGLAFGWRLPLTRVLILLLLLHMSLQHQRYMEELGLVAPLLAAPLLAPQLAARSAGRAPSRIDRFAIALARPAGAGGVLLAGILLILAGAAALYVKGSPRPPRNITPAAALAAVASHHIAGPVLNDYAFGGYLIFSGIAPMIDGRNELYGDAFIRRYAEAIEVVNGDLPKLLDDYHVSWTLFPPDRPAVILLDHLPGWRRLFSSDVAVVHLRENPAARDLPSASGTSPAAAPKAVPGR
jgi:hypothetical protein